jgi:hypothetical protein
MGSSGTSGTERGDRGDRTSDTNRGSGRQTQNRSPDKSGTSDDGEEE